MAAFAYAKDSGVIRNIARYIGLTAALPTALVAGGAIGASGCAETASPEPFSIEHIQVTQGIQNYFNQVPLIAGKTTFVRVVVRGDSSTGVSPSEITARLIIDGAPAIEPIGLQRLVPPDRSSDPLSLSDRFLRSTLSDSFLFRVPASATTAGARTAQVELLFPSGTSTGVQGRFPMRFGPTGTPPALRIYGVRYGYHNVPASAQAGFGLRDSNWPARSWADFEPQRAGAEAMLPMASLEVAQLPGDPVGDFDCRFREVPSAGCAGYEDARPWAQKLIDGAHPEGGAWIVILQPEVSGGHLGAHFVSPRGNHVINMQGDVVDVGATLAHEIGHGLGLLHSFDDPRYPRTNSALGPYVALRATPDPTLIPGEDGAGHSTASDIMSYAFTTWLSPYNYCRALVATSGGRLTCPSFLDGWN